MAKAAVVRADERTLELFKAVASFRGETLNAGIVSAMKALVAETFSEEIRKGQDILLQKLPEEIRLSMVCKHFNIPFPAHKSTQKQETEPPHS